jgi:hypothetical protein
VPLFYSFLLLVHLTIVTPIHSFRAEDAAELGKVYCIFCRLIFNITYIICAFYDAMTPEAVKSATPKHLADMQLPKGIPC